MKKIFFVLMFCLCSAPLFGEAEISHADISQQYAGTSQQFQVSAYYSPQPNQEKYVSGSYAADLRMNGNGTHGADGTPVYVGMLSAPSKYDFGDQIYLPGLGVGTVHDRGGAIVSAEGYDKLDVWMGRGDEGRIRAIQWGRKMVDGVVLEGSVTAGLEISTAEIARVKEEEITVGASIYRAQEQGDHKGTPLQEDVRKDTVHRVSTSLGNRFTENFSREDENEEIKNIQKFLIAQDVFSGGENLVTNYYGPKTENSVFLFQKKHGILDEWSDAGAGNWGPKTRAKANELSSRGVLHTPEISEKTHPSTPLGNHFTRNFSREDEDEDIKNIQKFLIAQDVFSGDVNSVTNYYGPKTENSVFLFQKKHGILDEWSDAGAGNWGPKTRAKANSL